MVHFHDVLSIGAVFALMGRYRLSFEIDSNHMLYIVARKKRDRRLLIDLKRLNGNEHETAYLPYTHFLHTVQSNVSALQYILNKLIGIAVHWLIQAPNILWPSPIEKGKDGVSILTRRFLLVLDS